MLLVDDNNRESVLSPDILSNITLEFALNALNPQFVQNIVNNHPGLNIKINNQQFKVNLLKTPTD